MAKAINIVSSNMRRVEIYVVVNKVQIQVFGKGIDEDDNEIPSNDIVMDWLDMPSNIQNAADNFLKHLSREYNKLIADEDSETWVAP
ncbi:MAG: hypothetical protein BBJ57_02255 [Desulfobacterales bacterium PC51MH44]|nr:MAG: hypothetical protein BBJ57_02255 [Desulfobacterales bacterium PC51MH44]